MVKVKFKLMLLAAGDGLEPSYVNGQCVDAYVEVEALS